LRRGALKLRRLALGATTVVISLGAVGLTSPATTSAATAPTARGHGAKPGPRVRVTLTSADLRQALSTAGTVSFTGGVAPALPTVAIGDSTRYQTMRSVGGAMTDTSAWLIQTGLTPGTRAWLMRRLF
jgi:glucosylceramidase